MEHPAAPLLAEHISKGTLRHTNARGEVGHIRIWPSQAGMSEEQINDTYGPLALAVSEASIETLREDCGHDVVPTAELKALRRQAAQASGQTPQAPISKCKRCGRDVLRPGEMIDVPTTIKALQGHMEGNCLP